MRLFFLLCTLLLNTSLAFAATEITFDVRKKKISKKNSEEKQETIKVILDKDYIEYDDSTGKHVIDFVKKRIYFRSPNDRKFFDYSLYSTIGFRSAELSNRIFLNHITKKAGINNEELMLDDVFLEHMFSINIPSDSISPQKSKGSKEIEYVYKGKRFFSQTINDEINLTKEEVGQLSKFFRYYYGIHPHILKEFTQKSMLPKIIEIYMYEMGSTEESKLTLRSYTQLENYIPTHLTAHSISNVNREKSNDKDRFLSLFTIADSLSQRDILEKKDLALKTAINSAEKKSLFSSLLRFFEYVNMTGEGLPKEFFKFKDEIIKDKDYFLFISFINPQSSNVKKSLEILKNLEYSIKNEKYLLFPYEANLFIMDKQSNKAKDLFYQTLLRNPAMVIVWNDLGRLFFSEYNMVYAWKCWDIERKISPNHSIVSDVTNLEKTLEAKYPDFF